MAISQHPSAQLIADYLIANVSPGVALAVATHIDLCPACGLAVSSAQGDVRRASQPGAAWRSGAHLAGGHAFDRLPRASLRPWIVLRQGLEGALVVDAAGLGEHVYVLRAAPRTDAAATTLRSAYVLLVLEGAVVTEGRRLTAGDFIEFDTPPLSVLSDAILGASVLVVAEDCPRQLAEQAADG